MNNICLLNFDVIPNLYKSFAWLKLIKKFYEKSFYCVGWVILFRISTSFENHISESYTNFIVSNALFMSSNQFQTKYCAINNLLLFFIILYLWYISS